MSSVNGGELDPALKITFVRHNFSAALSEMAQDSRPLCRRLSNLRAGKSSPMKICQKPTTLTPKDQQLQLQPLSWLLEFRQAGVSSARSRSGKPSVHAGSPGQPASSTKKLGPVRGPASGA